ncbi:Cell division cycle-associated protein 7 [Auxenochlorella protothecoides]|nr:Cell division cycle-associated protein 7 [Auxenochlorella protothecoides]KFM22893.1 Cell division cycle-associated protein 7 [Auxenochlorella protothecoides]
MPGHARGAAPRVTQGFPASGARVEAGEPPAARESTATGPPAAAESTVPEQAECQTPPMQGPVLQNFPAAGLQGWPDLAQAPGWSFRLDMYGYPLFISPEGYCCHSWEEVQSTVNSLPRLRTQKAQRTLAWIREAAATSSGGRLMHPANLAKMMALQRLRAATFAEEGRSARVAGNPAVVYNESDLARAGLAEEERTKHDRRLLKENIREEVYGVQHLSALGSHTKEWTLFEDGYDKSGNRIYDKVSGQTCHQCRQKTLGLRTHCSECQSLHGVFCGDCLFMRYGENVEEALQDSEWKCPGCRDLCNCSFHRSRRGWAPTGTLYRRAVAEGFVSVAHYLVLNNLAPEARSAALPLMPKELADATRAELEREAAGCDRRSASPAGPATPCASGEAAQDRAAQRPQAPGEEEASASPSPARPSGEEAGEAPTGRRRGARRQSTLRSDVLGAVVKTGGMIAAGKPGAGKRAGGTGKAAPAVERVGRGLRTSSRLVAGRA